MLTRIYTAAEGLAITRELETLGLAGSALALNSGPPSTTTRRPPKPGECPVCLGAGLLSFNVPIGSPHFSALWRCPACNDGRELTAWLREHSGLKGELAEFRLENFRTTRGRREAHAAAVGFCESPRGFLTLWGDNGTGKSFLLAGVSNRLSERGVASFYIETEALLDAWRDTFRAETFDRAFRQVREVPVLLLDEFNSARATEWAVAKLRLLLHQRHADRESGTVLALDEDPTRVLRENFGDILSRCFDGRDRVVRVGDGDVRPMLKRKGRERR